jgi:RimJ/RimL family protein N-acetyltransferase
MTAPHIEGHTVQPLDDAAATALQRFFDADAEYFTDINGRDISMEETRAIVPPGRTHADKFIFSIAKDGRVVGLIDIIRGYPEPHIWFLGFLYIGKDARGAGLGRKALHAIYAWTKRQGAERLRLGVIEGNDRARRLYATEGFVQEGVREVDPAVKRMRRTLVLERAL